MALSCPACGAANDDSDATCWNCDQGLSGSGSAGALGPAARGSTRAADTSTANLQPLDEELDGVEDLSRADDGDWLKTGAWHVMGSGSALPVALHTSGAPPQGVRMRRVGDAVEIQRTDSSVEVRVDGRPVERATVSLISASVTVDGVAVTDEMVPADVLDPSDIPDYFAPIVIGRAPDCDFQISDEAVSARHAALSRQSGSLLLEDLDSANGTWVEDRRIKRAILNWKQPFELGGVVLTPIEILAAVQTTRFAQSTSFLSALSVDELATLMGAETSQVGGALQGRLQVGDTILIGRDPTANIVIDTPNVSRLHAKITKLANGMVVEDLGSTNGTFVNGDRIRAATPLEPADDLRVGPHKISLDSDGALSADVNATGVTGVRLDGSALVREVPKGAGTLRVIDDLSFSILPGEMVAIMGPSGAGKTSALTTIAGYTPPTSGTVWMDGLDLYGHYDVFRNAIGYVPQEDVMHRTLTVQEVLHYQARLNFPAEVTDEEIDRRIGTVLGQLDLDKQRHSLVGDAVVRGLSGGQRRRLNVAMELLGQPSLLLLDEPTSGLDARSAMQLIQKCRSLASEGRTVVMTIHQPRKEAFELFDKLMLLTKGGKLAFFGPAREARRFFEERSEVPGELASNPADYVLDVLDPIDPALARSPDTWQNSFRNSRLHKRFVKGRLGASEREHEAQVARRPKIPKASGPRQWWTLSKRYLQLKWRDRNALAVQLLQAPVIGLLALLLFRKGRYHPIALDDDITPSLFVIMAAAVWFGCSNVAREIVGEAAIFRRERMGNLRAGTYLLSKLALQALFVAVQVGTLMVILVPGVPLQGGVLPLFGTAMLAGCAAMAMGLLVSTVARTELQAIQLVPLVILPQIMLSGILLPVAGDKASVMAAWLSKPVLLRWAYSAGLHVEFAEHTLRGDKSRGIAGANFWQRNGFGDDVLRTDLLVMAGVGLGCTLLTYVILKRRDRR